MILHSYLLSIPMAGKVYKIAKFSAFEYPIYETHIQKFLLRKGIFEIMHNHFRNEYQNELKNYWDNGSMEIIFDAKTGIFELKRSGVASFLHNKIFK